MELLVEQAHHGGGIAAAAAQPGPSRDALVKVYGLWGQPELMFHIEKYTDNEIVDRSALNGQPCQLKLVFGIVEIQRLYLKHILQRNGQKDRLDVMVTVTALFCNVEPQIYLCIRKADHGESRKIVRMQKYKYILTRERRDMFFSFS